MPAPIKISRALSLLLLRDLPRYVAMAEQAGIRAPKLSLEYADGLTRTDAVALQQWGQKIPAVRAAFANMAHPDHQAVRAFAALATHFAAVHPQAENGEPAPWTEPLSIGMRAVLTGADIPHEFLPAAEAKALLDYHLTRSDLVAAHRDKSDPRHAQVAAEVEALAARALSKPDAAGEVSANPDSGGGRPVNGQPPAAAANAEPADPRQQINALLANADFKRAYFDKHQRGHAEAVAEMNRLHEALVPGNAAGATPAGQSSPIAGSALEALQSKIAAINGQLRQFQLSAPDRAVLAEEVAFLSSQLPPGVRAAMPADRTIPTGRRPVETVVVAGRGLTERSIALTERLKSGGLRGQARADVLDQLQAALDAGQAEADAAPAEGGEAA
jgi:hypothetical protein